MLRALAVMVTMVVVRMAKDNKKHPLSGVVSLGCKVSVVGTEVDLTGFDSCVLRLAQASPAPVSVGSGPSIPPLCVDASLLPEVCFC